MLVRVGHLPVSMEDVSLCMAEYVDFCEETGKELTKEEKMFGRLFDIYADARCKYSRNTEWHLPEELAQFVEKKMDELAQFLSRYDEEREVVRLRVVEARA